MSMWEKEGYIRFDDFSNNTWIHTYVYFFDVF